jgi:broad specificity phosphatase PhoE
MVRSTKFEMFTTVYLIRNADTDFSRDKRVAGRRDIGLSAAGRAQAEQARKNLIGVDVTEVLASPTPRAVETAEIVAATLGMGVVRDPRLNDFDAGKWEARTYDEIAATDEFRRFLQSPAEQSIPGGERLNEVRDRIVSAVTQALSDNELGATIIIVSHAGPLRLLLAHYLGMELTHYHRLRLSPASLSILRFESERGAPRILTINSGADPVSVLR